eukprot:TRINITY_DN1181_c0_g1_i3.p2 TRINITY_DN1181_c0_g1~~TRINITY_DN1181_c0_g1_i3.p2  ORF type:complete len:181 (-),score=0.27 TRINITY_DN1181_c0_g1_i3:239-781(-)
MAARSCLCGALSLRNGVQAISLFWILFGIVGFASLFTPTLNDVRALGMSSVATFQIFFTVVDVLFQWSMSPILLLASRNTTYSNYVTQRQYTRYGTILYFIRYIIMLPYYVVCYIGIIVILSTWNNIESRARKNWDESTEFQDTADAVRQVFVNYLIGCIFFLPLETYFLWIVAGFKQQV